MTIIKQDQTIKDTLRDIAQKMLLAARTAPKGRGVDNTVMILIDGEDIQKLSKKMKEIGEKNEHQTFIRDAENILNASFIVIMGTKIKSLGLKTCGMCGFKDCAEKDKHPEIPCVLNIGDLGIAIGSAVSIAMDNRVDNRIMYTIGMAARELGLLGKDVKVAYGIPLSATAKNPFFDRK